MIVDDAIVEVTAQGIGISFDPRYGMITEIRVEQEGRMVSMLHKAPWRGDATLLPAGSAPHLAGLAGDFFCAPFGDASADGAPPHGWCANSEWEHLDTFREGAATVASFKLARRVMGAELTKELRLMDGHPFVYQRHIFEGGMGTIPVANHAMVALPDGGRISFSPKRWWETPAQPLESDPTRGRSILSYPAQSKHSHRFPLQNGGSADLTTYPFGDAHEDFAIGVEADDSPLGWSTVARESQGDLFISLRDPRRLPMTMLWFSNGGRDYAPWSSRHTGVLGVEEGLNRAHLGVSSAQDPHPLDLAGVPTGLTLDLATTTEVRHIIGSIPWSGSGVIESVETNGVTITGHGRTSRQTIPVYTKFLGLAS